MNLDTEALKPPNDHGSIKLKCMVNDILNVMFINCFQSLYYTGLPEQFHLGREWIKIESKVRFPVQSYIYFHCIFAHSFVV